MNDNRRDVSTRKVGVFQSLARGLCAMGLTPNMVSILSMVFAFIGFCGFYLLSVNNFMIGWFLAFLGIQLRLICNLIDGLMAVEGGLKTRFGEVFNDLPDRISDVFLIFGASLLIQHEFARDLGWLASILAVMTAYVRLLAKSMGYKMDFCGPMAKQHRMAMLNLALLLAMVVHLLRFEYYISNIFLWVLVLIAAGSFVTCIRRLLRMCGQSPVISIRAAHKQKV